MREGTDSRQDKTDVILIIADYSGKEDETGGIW